MLVTTFATCIPKITNADALHRATIKIYRYFYYDYHHIDLKY